MKSLKFCLVSIIFLCAVCVLPASGQINDPAEYFRKNVVHRTMPNGINVMMLNRGYAPALALLISFRAGSVDESYNTIGVAHMLEHMLFKGTDKIGTTDYKKEKVILDRMEAVGEKLNSIYLKNPGIKDNKETERLKAELKKLQEEHRKYVVSSPYSKIYTENGGVGFNAGTSRDTTTYYIELPASKLELWAKLESERLRNPVLREFYTEKGAVLEERLMSYESNGDGSLFEQFYCQCFYSASVQAPYNRMEVEH